MNAMIRIAVPVALGIVVLAAWQFAVRHFDVPVYVLPAPSDIARAFVAEFSAGSGSDSGIGWTITEAGNRLHIAKMFAAMGLLSAAGVAIFFLLSALEWLLLHRWHESALDPQA